MARQKPQQVLHIAPAPAPKKNGDEDDEDIASSSEDEDDERRVLPAAELLKLGRDAFAAEDYNDAVRLFEWAVSSRVSELGNEEVHPDLAEYWLEYGNAVFSRMELCGDLFGDGDNGEEDDDDDGSKEAAYESMDLARVCYEKKLEDHLRSETLKPINMPEEDLQTWVLRKPTAQDPDVPWKPTSCSEHSHIVHDVKKATFTRIRLGDFHQALHEHDKAIEEFNAALELCATFARPYSEALTPAVPLAHSRLALHDELTEQTFEVSSFCSLLEIPTPAAVQDTRTQRIRRRDRSRAREERNSREFIG